MEKSLLSECKQSSSLTFLALFNLFLIRFGRWVSSARIFLSSFLPLLQHHQRVRNQDQSVITNIEEKEEEEEDQYEYLCREDAEMVMRSLGLSPDQESDELRERYSSKEMSSLFEEKEASLEEVKQAFDVFDENRDGFIDATELQRVLTILGFKEGSYLENCMVMIRSLNGNKDGRLDFNGFVKFMVKLQKGLKMSVRRAPLMNLIRLKGTPILEQLHLEERLLRTSSDNWCIVNDGTNVPTIVMGLSGKPSQLLELGPVIKDRIPVIKRFTGGGTVIVDKSTLFVSLICNKDDVPSVQPYPRSVMAWSGSLYGQVFEGVDGFLLRENDYVFGDRKFGGNAQSIIRNRWIHHTSFLWDYNVRNMAYLKLPSKVPQYRLERDHTDFVCRMKDYIERSDFIEKTVKAVGKQFAMKQVNLEDIDSYAKGEHVKSTRLLTVEELQEAMSGTAQSAKLL
ncbi:hypothetical protein Bca101_013790 [Brassica carinata]